MLRVGILEFINHRRRETTTDGGGQRITTRFMQRFIEASQHIVKAKFATTTFFLLHGVADFSHRTSNDQIAKGQRLTE
ncbi:hypothetical protein D3C75_1337060 [compost metagenome]